MQLIASQVLTQLDLFLIQAINLLSSELKRYLKIGIKNLRIFTYQFFLFQLNADFYHLKMFKLILSLEYIKIF